MVEKVIRIVTKQCAHNSANEIIGDGETTPKPKMEEDVTPPNEHFHEHNFWEDVAKEDLVWALQRAVQYARDKVKVDPAKTAEEYYSELVAEVIKQGDLKFDASYLQ